MFIHGHEDESYRLNTDEDVLIRDSVRFVCDTLCDKYNVSHERICLNVIAFSFDIYMRMNNFEPDGRRREKLSSLFCDAMREFIRSETEVN